MKTLSRLFALIAFCGSALAVAQIPDDVTLDVVPGISGLSGALGLKNAGDGSNRLFIVQQNGNVRIVDADGSLLATPFVSVGSLVENSGERGLLDIAFHPEFAVNGLFYLHYSDSTNCDIPNDPPPCGDTVVAEFLVTADPNVGSSTPERIILTVGQDFTNHNGGGMNFGPDGYLYLGLGDGGSGNDPCDRSQTLNPSNLVVPGSGSCSSSNAVLADSLALLGKMLRVDVDNTTPAGSNNLCAGNTNGSANYAIPDTNPFFGQVDRCGEVLLYGIRNPWRWSFDRLTNDLWIGDVGQGTWEENTLLPWPLVGGDDLGWKICEGSFQRGSTSTACPATGSVLPVIEYRRNAGNCSITGGYRYRGPVNSMSGKYIYGDYCTGNIWFATEAAGNWTSDLFDAIGFDLRSFGQDEQGNLYVVQSGALQRFNGNIEQLFNDGFES